MALALPRRFERALAARPGDIRAEALVEVQPVRGAIGARVRGVGVCPVLECVDRGDPGQQRGQAFEQFAAVPAGILLGVEVAQVREREQFHAHRGDLGELDRAASVGQQRVVRAEHAVEGVAGLMHHRHEVALHARRIHEDERLAAGLALVLVAAGLLALPALEVQAFAGSHRVEERTEATAHVVEDAAAAVHEFVGSLERAQGRATEHVDLEVPRTERVELQRRAALLVELAHQGHADLLARGVESLAVGGRVVEAVHALVLEVAVVVEARVERHAMPLRDEPVVDAVDRLGILKPAVGDGSPAGFAHAAVGHFEVARHLRQRLLLAVELDRHGAGDLAVLLLELGALGLDLDVLRPEELDFLAQAPQQHAVALLVQVLGERALDDAAIELEADALEVRIDVLHEVEEGLAARLALGVAGHRDVEVRLGFGDHRIKVAAVEEQAFEAPCALQRALDERSIQRLELGPRRGVESGGDEGAQCGSRGAARGRHGVRFRSGEVYAARPSNPARVMRRCGAQAVGCGRSRRGLRPASPRPSRPPR